VLRRGLALVALTLVIAASAKAAQPYNVSYHAFPLPSGDVSYTTAPDGLWTSPWFQTGFGFTELVSS